jgi:serine/threonine protein kinase
MVLEFCNRGTLSDAIQRGWMLTVRDGQPQPGEVNLLRAVITAREVAGALEYLHSQNVLHGDLNGNNILLAGAAVSPERGDLRGFTAKVADFGLSRLLAPGGWVGDFGGGEGMTASSLSGQCAGGGG